MVKTKYFVSTKWNADQFQEAIDEVEKKRDKYINDNLEIIGDIVKELLNIEVIQTPHQSYPVYLYAIITFSYNEQYLAA